MSVRLLITTFLVAVSGCSQSLYNSPSFLNSRNPDADRARFERFDPLPDENAGPDTFSRPPGYVIQRTQERQAAESRTLLGVPTSPPRTPGPTSENQYPGVVRE